MKKTKSLEINGILNSIRSLIRVAFPLITLPYISRVLHADSLGEYNYASTYVAYFSYIAALGITGYSIRSGSELRDNKTAINRFSSEVFSINVVTTIISYFLFFVFIILSNKVQQYKKLVLILGIGIVFNTISVEWINSIYEDFLYITLRSIIIQIVSLILLFVFVKTPEDLYTYAVITVLPTAITGIINWIYVKKYCVIKYTFSLNLRKHLLSIIIIFLSDFAIFIYVSSDITMLGHYYSDYYVGLYSFSTKLYSGIKTVLSAIVTVSIPRLSFLYGNGKIDEFRYTVTKIFEAMLTFMLPMVIGMYCVADNLIKVVGGEEYLPSNTSLKLLCVALVFCEFSYIYTQCILMPLHEEKRLMYITLASALVNIGLNLVLIPKMHEIGAAFTTIVAEAFVFLASIIVVNKRMRLISPFKSIWKPLTGCVFIVIACLIIQNLGLNSIKTVVLCVLISAVLYFSIELLLKNEFALSIIKKVVGKEE